VLERNGDHAPIGTVDLVAERLKALEELGYERVMLQHLAHRDLDTIAMIGRELAPAVA
jgi:alkanesulfonate monooxygenase SsuD/methylene tetrahydromethanopterin reductase-like flavin-dependent oxidoreductase (luciferase family)